MERFDFETLVDRTSSGSLKLSMVPDCCSKEDMIGFAGAEMDFPTAPVITERLSEFARKGIYGFTLKDTRYDEAISWWMRHSRECDVKAEEIVVSSGTIFALGTAIRAFTNPNDGVILQKPVYYRFDNVIIRNQRRVVDNPLILEDDCSYKVDFTDLERKMSDESVKMMVLCNPHNPVGKVYTKDEMLRIAELARKHNVVVFSDEIFADIGFSGTVIPFFSIAEDVGITCTSLGKSFNFTGVNQSNLIIRDKKLRDTFEHQKSVDHFGSIDPFFYQSIIAGYSQEGLDWVNAMKDKVWENYQLLRKGIDFPISPLMGSFVCWIDFRKLGIEAKQLDDYLVNRAYLSLDPGFEYGDNGAGFARMNLACPTHYIESAITRIRRLASEHN